ncbi:MAG: hypothetical protein M3072_16155 [Candidatus Dormibacteraeota bacterium]|nr:hypothetical protein [Candidatus Dormibacteraeota bacterium]
MRLATLLEELRDRSRQESRSLNETGRSGDSSALVRLCVGEGDLRDLEEAMTGLPITSVLGRELRCDRWRMNDSTAIEMCIRPGDPPLDCPEDPRRCHAGL